MPTPKEELKRGIKQFIVVLLMLCAIVAFTYIKPPAKPQDTAPTIAESVPESRIYKNGIFLGYSDATDHGYGVAIVTIEGDNITDVVLKEFTEMSIEKDFTTYEYPPSVRAHSLLPRIFMQNPLPEVEGISGATASSERYRRAFERALAKAKIDAAEELMDGTYQGRSKADQRGYGIARVTIVQGKIAGVELKEIDENGEFKDFAVYPHEPSVKAYHELPERFAKANSPAIDNFTGATHSTEKYKEAVANAIAKADPLKPAPRLYPGTYTAISDADRLGYSKAAVTIENSEIVGVRLSEYDENSRQKDFDHYDYEPSVNAYQELPWSFILAQSPDIDAVTGATYSSLHYMQAAKRAVTMAANPRGIASFDGVFQAGSDEDENGYAVATVQVKKGKIESVSLKAFDGQGRLKDTETYPHEPYRRAVKELPNLFIKANSPEVDAIAGATRSCRQFKQALTRALTQVMEQVWDGS